VVRDEQERRTPIHAVERPRRGHDQREEEDGEDEGGAGGDGRARVGTRSDAGVEGKDAP
jgi:hypothetical protein